MGLKVKVDDALDSPRLFTAFKFKVYETPLIKPGMEIGEVASEGLSAMYSPPLIEYL
jgi:hypothetical protein